MPEPILGNGKICYVQIPSDDIRISAAFYHKVFGWPIRKKNDGSLAFDDGVGQVSGTWSLGEKASPRQGMLLYIMVDNAETTMLKIISNGGSILQESGADAPDITAKFSDPFGNVWGIFQQSL